MKRRLVSVALAGILLMGVTPAFASEMPAPGNGPAFGQKIASVAPDCAREMGAEFGAHVSKMAQGEPCGCAH